MASTVQPAVIEVENGFVLATLEKATYVAEIIYAMQQTGYKTVGGISEMWRVPHLSDLRRFDGAREYIVIPSFTKVQKTRDEIIGRPHEIEALFERQVRITFMCDGLNPTSIVGRSLLLQPTYHYVFRRL